MPGHDLTSLCAGGQDEQATEIIASLIRGMPVVRDAPHRAGSVERLHADFTQFRNGAEGFIPIDFVDRAAALFAKLCASRRHVRLLHGDLHHFNVLFDSTAGWVAIDPWGQMGEIS
jgi:streptomycin 6-kinase